ncbi:hypothetical protein CRI93_05670 [Longimonas halophila]|uniref:Sodium-translocating pyrophosphatase n=1 Tax=Longimonas halophila TaxID=1469170 RepID=A0A2H3NQI6_9BACT|nr:hypothetical protein [Longimonas halophila]PEN07933.1 hypothetical protein CRI93_05670 [Longimonas halophila]
MVLTVIFLGTLLIFFGSITIMARGDIKSMGRQGPARVAEHLQSRNRVVIGVVAAILVGIALLEVLIPVVHQGLADLQYEVGYFLNASPTAVITLGSGGGISWGLYLTILLATVLGVLGGSIWACKSYGATQGIESGQLV